MGTAAPTKVVGETKDNTEKSFIDDDKNDALRQKPL